MKNIFEKAYAAVQGAREAYSKAESEEEKAAARALNDAALQSILALGDMDHRVWRYYLQAKESGNEYIDINDVVWDRDVASLVSTIRKHGIEKFTFSSGWSSAVDTAWLFQKNGCKLEGLVEVNGSTKAFLSEEYERVHGYLFKV